MAPEFGKMVTSQPIDLMIAMKDRICEGSSFTVEQVVDRLRIVNVHLTLEECYLLLSSVMPSQKEEAQFDPEHITPNQLSRMFDALDNRIALRVLFEKYSIPILATMGAEQLKTFFCKEQGKDKSKWYCRQLIHKVNQSDSEHKLTLNGFYQLLSMHSFGLFNPVHQQPCQDMTKPLTHYFVATSEHIRFPEDEQDQLLQTYSDIGANHSTEEAIILAKYRHLLLTGFRCLQIRLVWDENAFFVAVHHESANRYYYVPIGNFLREVHRSAFESCHFPVILQFASEHLREKYKILSDQVQSKLQGHLYKPSKKLIQFPSPKSLQNKILVYFTVPSRDSSLVDICSLLSDEIDEPMEVNFKLANLYDILGKGNFWDAISVQCSELMCQVERSVVQGESERNRWPTVCERNLISLRDTTERQPTTAPAADCSQVAVNLLRVGVQCIPLRPEYIIQRALFHLNGRCGYVLKPIYLRKGQLYKRNSSDKLLKNELPSSVNKYTVRIICAQNMMHYQEDMNTTVTMRVIGHEKDNLTKFSTKVCSSDGLVPFWNEQTRFWIRIPDLAFLYFQVHNNGEMIGYHVIPVKALLKGNRHVPLYDRQHRLIENAKLFLHIDYKEIVSGWYPSDPDPPQEDLSEQVDNNGT